MKTFLSSDWKNIYQVNKSKNIISFLKKICNYIIFWTQLIIIFIHRNIFWKNQFSFLWEKLNYSNYWYNKTSLNERSIEISIAKYFIKKLNNKNLLEIWAVIKHYFSFNHLVLDKFEIWDDIINQDIIDYKLPDSIDTIISISTMEHVWIDDDAIDFKKWYDAIKYIVDEAEKKNINYLITYPYWYSPWLDKFIREFSTVKISTNH